MAGNGDYLSSTHPPFLRLQPLLPPFKLLSQLLLLPLLLPLSPLLLLSLLLLLRMPPLMPLLLLHLMLTDSLVSMALSSFVPLPLLDLLVDLLFLPNKRLLTLRQATTEPLSIRPAQTLTTHLVKSAKQSTSTQNDARHAAERREPPMIRMLAAAPRELVRRLKSTSIGKYSHSTVTLWRSLTISSDLRLALHGVIDREMGLVHDHNSSIELVESAQRYVGQLAQMDSQAMQNANRTDLNEFKEDHFEEIATGLVKRVCEELNRFLAAKGQYIQPRLSLPSKMKNEDEEDEEDDDSEEDSKPRVKRERD